MIPASTQTSSRPTRGWSRPSDEPGRTHRNATRTAELRDLRSVEPGPGLFFFAAVVVLTMLAVESFDPRLIWDATNVKEVRDG